MADRYWRGGTGTWNTSSTTNWSDTSGGAGGFSVPTASDNVFFDQAATYNVTMTGALACLNITVSAGTVSFLTGTGPTLQVNGSMSLIAMTWTSTGAITFNATTTGQTITTGGTTINAPITFNGVGGEWSLSSALTTGATQTTTLTNGSLILNGFDLTTGIFSSSNTNTRSIAFGTNNIILSHTTAAQTVLSMATATGFTYTSSTSIGSGTGCFYSTMSTTRTFVFGTTGGSTTTAPTLYLVSGASIATITTGSWFNELNLGSCSFTIAATNLNLNSLQTPNFTGVHTNLTATMVGTGNIYLNGAKSIGPLVINSTSGTTTVQGGSTLLCTTCTLTSGTLDLSTSATLTCSSTFTWTSGSLINIGALNCTTFTLNGPTFNFTGGGITPSVSFVVTSGSFTYNGGTLSAVPTFTHTAGTVQFNYDYALTATGTYTFTAGTLSINDGVTLSTGIFSSTNTNSRTINFGLTTSPGYIALTHTTAATVVLNIAIMTGLTVNALGKWDSSGYGPTQTAGGFTSSTTVTKTFTCGTTGGNSANAPCLYVTGTGATQLPTFTTASWFGDFNIDGLSTMTIAATTLNINSLVFQGYYHSVNSTSMNLNFVGSGAIQNQGDTNNTFGILGAVTINHSGTTVMVYAVCPATTVSFTSGTLECRYWVNSGFNGYGQFKLTGTFTQTGGTWYNNAVYIASCTTYTVNGPTISFDSGSITATTSMVLTSGSFTFNGGTTSALPLFTHTAGTVRIKANQTVSLAATGTYTLTAGSLILENGSTVLNTGIFSSTGTGVRSITFGETAGGYPPFINLTHTTAATTVLSMATVTNFTYTAAYDIGYGVGNAGFVSAMPATQTFVFGTTGGSITNSPNLRITGASTPTITTGSWFNLLDMASAGAFTLPATSLNLNSLYGSSSSAVLTGLTANMRGSGVLVGTGYTVGPVVINTSGIVQIQPTFPAPFYGIQPFNCTTLTITAGTLDGGVQTFTGSCTAGVLTTVGSPTLVPGSMITDGVSGTYGYVGTVVSGSGNTWVLSNSALSFGSTPLATNGAQTYGGVPLTCSAGVTWTGGSLTNFGSTTALTAGGSSSVTLTCTTFTVNGSTFNHTLENGGTINPSTSFVLTSGSYTYNGGVLGAVPLFTHTAGTATFNYDYSLTTTGTYTLTAGTLTLADGVILNTGIFSSTGAGTRSIGFGASVTSGSVAFNGVDQYLTSPSSSAYEFGTGDFTVEGWYYWNTFDNNVDTALIMLGQGANPGIICSWWMRYYTGTPALSWYRTDGTGEDNFLFPIALSTKQWYHIACTRSGTGLRFFVNGTQVGDAQTCTIDYTIVNGDPLQIGKSTTGNSPVIHYFNGYASNIRVVKGVAVYDASFVPPTTPLTAVTGTQLLVDVASSGAYLTDGSTNNFTLTPTGTVTYNASTPVNTGGSLYFDQSTISYLTLPSSTAFDLTGDFTIEAWVYMTTLLAGNNGIIDARVNAQSAAPWVLCLDGTGKLLFFNGTYYTAATTISTGVWTHVAAVRSGSTLTLYVNGVSDLTANIGTGAISPGTTSAVIGTKDYGINAQFRAINYITNLRIVNGTAIYTAPGNFTPASTPLPVVQPANVYGSPSNAITGTQTSLLLNTPNNVNFLLDSSTYNVTITNNGTATKFSYNPFSGFINLTSTTPAAVVLNMAALGGFTYTGGGGFTVADMSNTRTFSAGNTSGGSITTAPTLAFTTGASIPTMTTGSWFNNLDFGTTSFAIAATSLNLTGALTLSSSGTYTNLTAIMRDTGTSILTTNGKTIAALTVNGPAGVFTFAGALIITGALTLTAGTVNTAYAITSASFASAGPYSRSIVGPTTYTISGAGTTAWNFGSTGSALFNGSTQYLTVPDNAAFVFTGDFTMEAWIYPTSFGGTNGNAIAAHWPGISPTDCAWIFQITSTGKVSLVYGIGATNTTVTGTSLSCSLNVWNHVAVTRSGSTVNFFVNGVADATTPTVSGSLNDSTAVVSIGRINATDLGYFTGYITNLRLVKGVAVYTGNFTTPTAPLLPTQSSGTNISAITGTQTSLLLSTPINSFLTDYSNNNFTVTNVGTATANILSPFSVMSPGITFTGFTINMTNAAAKTFAGGGATYPVLNNGGAGALTISGSNTFETISNSVQPTTFTFTINTTQTVNYFNVAGIAGSLVTINSSTAATAATLSKASGTVYGSYLSIRDSTATGGATWYAGPTSTNTSNNTGWIFARLPIVTFGNLTVADGGFTVSDDPVVF